MKCSGKAYVSCGHPFTFLALYFLVCTSPCTFASLTCVETINWCTSLSLKRHSFERSFQVRKVREKCTFGWEQRRNEFCCLSHKPLPVTSLCTLHHRGADSSVRLTMYLMPTMACDCIPEVTVSFYNTRNCCNAGVRSVFRYKTSLLELHHVSVYKRRFTSNFDELRLRKD